LLDPGLGPSLVGRDLTLGYKSAGLAFGSLGACGSSSPKWKSLYPISPNVFLFLSGRWDGTFWVFVAVTSGLGLLVSLCLWLDQTTRVNTSAFSQLYQLSRAIFG